MLRRTPIVLLLPLLALAGCGNSRAPVPGLSAAATPSGVRTLNFPKAGIRFQAPRNWTLVSGPAPMVTTVTSGAAVVALWRFPRVQHLPADAAALSRARAELIRTARARDATLQVIRSKVVKVDGAHAVELDAIERVGTQLRRVRSTHVFAYGAELVLDEYAPPDAFHTVDQSVFSPLKRSLLLFPAASG